MSAPRCGFPDIPDSLDDQAPKVASFKACKFKTKFSASNF